ncbi:Solute carrier family 35 member C2 [Nymphon striatum]|nr:Solute carrier family 35 member C2 [Nymphon striatum]
MGVFATSHGKSPCDDIGGTVKSLTAQASLKRTVTGHILDVDKMFKFCETNIKTFNSMLQKTTLNKVRSTFKPRDPSLEIFETLKKSELILLAKHLEIEYTPSQTKKTFRSKILQYFVDEDIFDDDVLIDSPLPEQKSKAHKKERKDEISPNELSPIKPLLSTSKEDFNKTSSQSDVLRSYEPFVSAGNISLFKDSHSKPIKILRATGASLSLLSADILSLSVHPLSTDESVLIQDVECGIISVPLYCVKLKSDLVNGTVKVGVDSSLPVNGIHLLLGNDLAGFFCAIDIGLSNWSFEFITISLCGRMDTTCIPRAKLSRYTMSKSSTIIFILIFSIMLGLEKFKKSLVGIVLLIAGGLFMFTFHSTQFNLEGFILVMLAALTSGLRWTLAQLVMQKNEIGLGNPLDMVYHVQPWMILSLIPLFIGFEGESISRSILFNYEDVNVMLQIVGLMSIGAVIAFLMEISEYLLEILTLILAVKVNNNKMNSVNMLGLVLCILGISTHVVIKVLNNKKSSKEQIEVEMKGLLPFDNSSDEDELFDKNMLR